MAPPPAPVVPPALPAAPTAAGSALPPTPPAAPGALPLPATVNPDGKIKDRPEAKDLTNPFDRQATLIVDTAQDWAERLAQNLGEHPSDTVATPSSTVAEMFNFSPYGTDAPAQFWREHDQLLQMAIASNDPDPYAVAERGALASVYPYRAQLALLDSLGPEQRVQRAEQLLAVHHNEIARGNPPDALPSIVGPAGLPEPAKPQQEAPY
jgi:hypothetical protein